MSLVVCPCRLEMVVKPLYKDQVRSYTHCWGQSLFMDRTKRIWCLKTGSGHSRILDLNYVIRNAKQIKLSFQISKFLVGLSTQRQIEDWCYFWYHQQWQKLVLFLIPSALLTSNKKCFWRPLVVTCGYWSATRTAFEDHLWWETMTVITVGFAANSVSFPSRLF